MDEETLAMDPPIQETTVVATDEPKNTAHGKAIVTADAPEEALIAELRPSSYDKVLIARVYRKWVAVSYQKSGKKTETGFCCILIDREGNAIQGNMDVKDIDHFNPKIKLGSVYKISEFMCEPTNPYQQTIDNQTSLRFGRVTKFDLMPETDIPHHYFRFVSYNQLHSRIPKEDATGKMQYPILTDYIGCLRSPGEKKQKGGANEDNTVYRKLEIENLNGNVVEFTMWNEMAEEFEKADLDTMEQPIIIAVSSCRVSKYRDYQLTATSATYYYLNPKIPEAYDSRAQYRAKYEKTPPLRICKTPYADIEKEKFRNRFPLKTLLKQDPESYASVRFTTEATITGINIKRDWYYISCSQCASKARCENGIYRCINHGKQEKICYRYNFKGFITDPSATAPVTFFTPAADDVTGYSCFELIQKHKAKDLQEIPPEIFAIEGQKNVFQIHFNTTSNTKDFVLDQVFDKKKRVEVTSTAIEMNPATPPAALELTIEKDIQAKTDDAAKIKTLKRPLFQDPVPEPKKQKAEASSGPTVETRSAEKKRQNQMASEGQKETP